MPGVTKSPCTQTHRPRDAPRGGRQSFRSRSPRTAPRSFARPWPGLRPGLADPRRFLPSPPAKSRASRIAPTAQPAAAPQAKFLRRVPSCVLGGGPHTTPPGTRVPPAANLLVRVCFFGHFLVHLDACPAACSLAPFIFLCARPPSSHLRHLLIWWWRGGARDEGGAEAGGEMESPEIRARSGKGHTRQRTPWAGRARPRGSEGVQRRDLGRGPGGGEQQKNKHAPGGGRAVGCAGAGPGSPPGTGPIRVPGSARRPGEMRLGGGAGRPVRAPSRHSTDLLHIGFSAPPTGGGSRAEAMTSSQRPEVVECKKLPTCDQNKRERGEREEKNTLTKHFVPPTERAPLLLPLPLASSQGGASEQHGWHCVCQDPNPCLRCSGF